MTNDGNLFKIWLTNFGWYSDRECYSFDDAKAEAKRLGFESRIDHVAYSNGNEYIPFAEPFPVVTFSPLNGFNQLLDMSEMPYGC